MTTTIFTEFLRVMDAQIDVQCGNIEFHTTVLLMCKLCNFYET